MSEEQIDHSLLPANSSALERALDLGFAKLVNRITPPFPSLMNPNETPTEFLPYLAADRGVAEWSANAAESEKRLTVGFSWPTKRQAGTRLALENAVRGLDYRLRYRRGMRSLLRVRHTVSPLELSLIGLTAKR